MTRRAEALAEFNPMLGMRGVRLGVVLPEIYDMQAQAIFEATVEIARKGTPVVPEIMIPLVSARREVELVKTHIDAVAASVRVKSGVAFALQTGGDGRNPARRPARGRNRAARRLSCPSAPTT